MLSTAAFNALLKTLEEPPPHVIFVLATTEAHKVLADGRLALPALRLPPLLACGRSWTGCATSRRARDWLLSRASPRRWRARPTAACVTR